MINPRQNSSFIEQGFVFFRGQWVPLEEKVRALREDRRSPHQDEDPFIEAGMVFHQGKWIPIEEKIQRLREPPRPSFAAPTVTPSVNISVNVSERKEDLTVKTISLPSVPDLQPLTPTPSDKSDESFGKTMQFSPQQMAELEPTPLQQSFVQPDPILPQVSSTELSKPPEKTSQVEIRLDPPILEERSRDVIETSMDPLFDERIDRLTSETNPDSSLDDLLWVRESRRKRWLYMIFWGIIASVAAAAVLYYFQYLPIK